MFKPVIPKKCPEASKLADGCKFHVERWRDRRKGPGFKLLVLYCLNHSGSFTLYPPGWMPYGRKSIDNLDMRGHFVVHESWNAKARWEETEFLAVTDAADGELWPIEGKLGPEISESEESQKLSQRTQRRAIIGAIRLLGLDPNLSDKERDRASRTLGIDLFDLTSGSKRIRDGPEIKKWALEGAKVLELLPAIFSTVSGLLALGTSLGYWGPTLL